MEHLAVGSTSSLERLRRLTRKLQRALATQESAGSVANAEDIEASPLVANLMPLASTESEKLKEIQSCVEENHDDSILEVPHLANKSNNVESSTPHYVPINNFDCETHV